MYRTAAVRQNDERTNGLLLAIAGQTIVDAEIARVTARVTAGAGRMRSRRRGVRRVRHRVMLLLRGVRVRSGL